MTAPLSGDIIFAADIRALLDLAAYKPSDTSRASTTTLAADPHLTLPVQANVVYLVEVSIAYSAATGVDLKWDFSVPAGATLDRYRFLVRTTTPALVHDIIATAASVGTADGDGGDDALSMWGTLIVGATAGDFALRWAQSVSNASATIVRAGSSLRLTPVV